MHYTLPFDRTEQVNTEQDTCHPFEKNKKISDHLNLKKMKCSDIVTLFLFYCSFPCFLHVISSFPSPMGFLEVIWQHCAVLMDAFRELACLFFKLAGWTGNTWPDSKDVIVESFCSEDI